MKTIVAHNLGDSTAENDSNLRNYYVPNDYFQFASDFAGKKTFFVGRKGIGKSAILAHIRQMHDPNMTININPDDFAFKLLEESDLVKELSPINYEVIYKYLWKYIVIIEILKHAFGTKKPFLPFTKANKVHDFLLECGEVSKSNMTMGERLIKMLEKIKASAGVKGVQLGMEIKINANEKTSQIEVFRAIDDLIDILPELLRHNKYYILIDDLDTGWQNTLVQNQFLRALFKALFKLVNIPNFKFVICLREDIFSQLHLEDSDKFNDYIVDMTWDEGFLREVIEKRISYAYSIPSESVWSVLFTKTISDTTPFNYLVKRTLCRPRDIVQFTQVCFERAARQKHKQITDGDIREAERTYSKRKISDLANEYKYVYPNLDRVLAFFAGKNRDLDYSTLEKVIYQVFEATETQKDEDVLNFRWIFNRYLNEPKELIRLFVEINFLGYRTSKQESACYGYEKKPIIISEKFRYRIHPCFANALDLT